MGVRVFTSPLIRQALSEAELQLLITKFREYKDTGNTQGYFGSDSTLNRPPSALQAGLKHIHLNEGRPWNVRLLQYKHTSDTHLVYCSGFFQEDCHLLITLIKDAHNKYRNSLYMMGLADIASSFRDKY